MKCRIFPLALVALLLAGCASAHNPSDPLEPINRGVYRFNDVLDRAVLKPVAQAYNYAVPVPGKIVVGNFFSNLDDVLVTANDLLQCKFNQAVSDGSRFLFNSTFGVFGLFNVASSLPKHNEDFGQTLGYWGVGNGPYLMLPLLGSSTVRDATGLYVDSFPSIYHRIESIPTRNQLYLTEKVQDRAALLDSEKVLDEAMLDRYEFIRDTYLLHRQSLVYDGNPPRERYDDESDDYAEPPQTAPATDNPTPPASSVPSL